MQTRILIIRFSSIGDIVLTTPVMRRLKQQLEGDVEIHYLSKKTFAPILETNPHIDRLWTMDQHLDDVLSELERIEFDYIIDLHRNLRTAKVKKSLKGLYFTFDKLNVKKWMLVNFGVDRLPRQHIVDRYLQALKAFSLEDDGGGLDYFIPEEVKAPLPRFSLAEGGYVAWVVGAAHDGKRFSAEKVARIIDRLGRPVALLGGKADIALSQKIVAISSTHVVDFTGRTSLHESARIIELSAVVVTPDTGMMHIAAALAKRIISLWGCTVPAFGMYPYRPPEGSVILQPKDKPKRPCSKLGSRCKYPENCIESIDEEMVHEAVADSFA